MAIQLFRLNFKLTTGFRVGGGQEIGDNVLRQLRIGTEGVLIPASSWKGMFRRVSEIVLNNRDHFEGHSKRK
ncbi:RAMP superfamily CRISPR-associated protein [Saccharolobus islandicus]|uniref:RAMP superfamily CRISPR-associated protein n=1 Tax=Saccharolobus islandicus TaxID=43080 RepID=UPI000B0C7970|nr:RAMP superfamily CRISPR-associated protein [Sulfolobus islandicus]